MAEAMQIFRLAIIAFNYTLFTSWFFSGVIPESKRVQMVKFNVA